MKHSLTSFLQRSTGTGQPSPTASSFCHTQNRGEMFMVVSSKTEPESRSVGSAADGDMWVCIQWEKLT
ncbi:hypothetical protein AOLI_G00172270 [Acnodon oligacanthus]